VVNKTLISQDKMKLIRNRKCLWCRAPGHTFKECKKRISKIPMRTATQVLSLQHTSKPVIAKNNYKGKTKAKPQSTEELDYSRVRVKVNGHPALALTDLQTTGGDLSTHNLCTYTAYLLMESTRSHSTPRSKDQRV